MSFDERIDNYSRVLMNPSFVLIWSFADPIHPLVSHTIFIVLVGLLQNLRDFHYR